MTPKPPSIHKHILSMSDVCFVYLHKDHAPPPPSKKTLTDTKTSSSHYSVYSFFFLLVIFACQIFSEGLIPSTKFLGSAPVTPEIISKEFRVSTTLQIYAS